MRLIPAGEFQMGSNDGDNDEKPVHTVYLDDYYIDETEVTNEQYCAFLNDYGKNADAAGHELLDIDSSSINKVGNTYKPGFFFEKYPVTGVTWYGAAAYAQWAWARLPTEAEWEKAARGGLVGKKYPWGDDITHDNANYSGTGGKDKWDGTSPVGSFAPNGYGLFDMAGDVWEWCADEYDSSYYSESPKNNPKGPGVIVTFKNNYFTNVTSRRVLRGGSWYINPYFLRCADRYYYVPSNASSLVGFRCSQDR
jgi:formylglycine-generating enzyme required for sulfatase activity